MPKKSEDIVTKHQHTCIEVSQNFMKIGNDQHKTAVRNLIKSLSA